MRRGLTGGLATTLLVALAACMGREGPIPLACGSVPPADPGVLADTLTVTVVLAEWPTRTTHVLVRVDPLSERGAVLFSGTPPASAAAVSASVSTDAVFHGCVNERADGFRLEAPRAPIGRVWVRVSSNRPVAVHLVTEAPARRSLDDGSAAVGGGETRPPAALVVPPGASGRHAWSFEPPSRSRE